MKYLCFFLFLISCNVQKKRTAPFYYCESSPRICGDIFFFDKIGYLNFIEKENLQNLNSMIYGYFVNDSFFKRPSILKNSVPACLNLMEKDLIKSRDYLNSSDLEYNNFVFTEHLLNYKTKSNYQNLKYPQGKIVLLYSKSIEKKFKKFYLKALEIAKQKNVSLIILSLDPVYSSL